MDNWITVASVSELENRARYLCELDDGTAVAIVRDGDAIHAFEDHCPHADMRFAEHATLCDGEVTCPWHGARFSLMTGSATAPPAYEPLTVFPVRITASGSIQIRDNRWDSD